MVTNEEFTSFMDNKLNEEGSFPQDKIQELTEKYSTMADHFGKLKPNEQALYTAEVNQDGDRISKHEMFKSNLASKLGSSSKLGHNPIEKLNKYAMDMLNIVDGNIDPTYEKNTPGFELSDGTWKSMDDIDRMIDEKNVDEPSKNIFQTMLTDQQAFASEIQKGENADFNFQKNYNKVKTQIIEQGNIKSLATDKIFGNRVFKDDLLSAIEKGTYNELGLDENAIKSMDPTPNNKITPEDAAAIVSGVLEDSDMLTEYLTDYYVKALEQNFYSSLNPDVKQAWELQQQAAKKQFQKTPTGMLSRPQSSTRSFSFENDIQTNTGVIRNGIFMPNKK